MIEELTIRKDEEVISHTFYDNGEYKTIIQDGFTIEIKMKSPSEDELVG